MSFQLLKITDREFKLLTELIYKNSGINLGEQKRALVEGRLNKLIKLRNLSSFQEYYDFVVKDSSGAELLILMDKISTNHTFFYREKDHFEYLSDTALPAAEKIISKQSGPNDLRMWVPGCSSGEEPYTLAILLKEYFKLKKSWVYGILATDISTAILSKAVAGKYLKENIEKLPPSIKNNNFLKISPEVWEVKPEIKSIITFRRLNLMRPVFPFKGKFHIIFCRNVMIYFDVSTRNALVKKFYDVLHPGGYLFVGHSESIGRDNKYFKYIKPAVYRKEPF